MTEYNKKRIDMARNEASALAAEQSTNNFNATGVASLDAVKQLIEQTAAEETPAQKAEREFLENLRSTRISVNDEFPEVCNILSIDGVGFFAQGNIHAIKAKQKNGKTNAIAIMVAAILNGEWGRLKAEIPNARVLVIDTEQSAPDAQLVYLRTLELAQMPSEDNYDRLQTFCLRSYTREDKVRALETLIKDFQPDIVFIDGVVDLMGNFNEVEESKAVIELLVRLSTKEVSGKDIAIVSVLHTNKANDDHNMRGHAGTMLSQKSSTVFEVKKDSGIFTVSNTDSRHKEVPTWSFRFDENDNIVEADTDREAHLEQRRTEQREAAEARNAKIREQRINELICVVNSFSGGINRKQLLSILMEKLKLGKSCISNFIKSCIDEQIIAINEYGNVILIKNCN